MLRFELWADDRQDVYIVPSEVAAVREYRDRQAYGGMNDVSQVILKNGERYVVRGHVAKLLQAES